MKTFIMALLLSLWGGSLAAQVLTVRDANTEKPLGSAALFTEDHSAFTVTNNKGEADLSDFGPADVIQIRLLGYAPEQIDMEQIRESDYTVYLRRTNFNLDQVVISATRRSERDRLIPNRIVKIDPKFVALENPQTAADLLGASGEVFVQKSQQGGGSPMIRGFATNRLLIAVDGVRMNTAIFRSGNLQNVISLDPLAMESTEVIFGPGSVIYGSDAIGGVMAFRTLRPQLSLEDEPLVTGKAVTRYASANNELTTHFDVNIGGQKWASVTSFTFTDYGDLRMGSEGPDEYLREFTVRRIDSTDVVLANDRPQVQLNSGYRQTNLMQKIRFRPSAEWNFTYGFHYSTTGDIPRYDRLIRTKKGVPRNAEWYYGPQTWMLNNLTIDHRRESKLFDLLTLNLSHQYFEESRIDRDFGDPLRRKRREQVDAYAINLDLTKSVGRKGQLIYGAEAVYDEVHSVGTLTDIDTGEKKPAAARYPESTWASYAAYAAYRHEVSDRLSFDIGGRYNAFDLDASFDTRFYPLPFEEAHISNGALTGNVGLVFQATDATRLTAVASTGFRAPNIDDVGKVFDSEPGSVVVPNPDLEAEYANNVELGASHVFYDRIKVDLTGYYTLLDNALVRRDFQLGGRDSIIYDGERSQVQAIQNAAEARIYGVQAAIEAKLPAGFGMSAQVNFQSGEEELDDGTTTPARHVAPFFGIARLTYEHEAVRVELNAVYNGEIAYEDLNVGERGKGYLYARDDAGNPYSPAWYTLNFKVWTQLNDHWSISGGVENLTDRRYRPYSSGLAGPGRNVILSIRATI